MGILSQKGKDADMETSDNRKGRVRVANYQKGTCGVNGSAKKWFRIEIKEVKEKLEQMEGFWTELEEMTKKLGQIEEKSARVERELGFLKAKEQTFTQQLDKDAPTIKKNQAQPKRQRKSLEKSTELVEEEEIPPTHSPRNTQVPREEIQETFEEEIAMSAREEATTIPSQVHSVKPKEPRSYATVAAAKPAQTPTQPWTKVSYGNRKIKSSAATQVEQRGRRILFPRKDGGEFKSEADLMLALNESLQKAGVDPKVRFSRVRYAPSGSISALLLEKADASMLLPQRSNLLIRAAKTVDDAVVGVEIFEQWQRLKVHEMSLDRYLGPGKLELLKKEVESSTGIQLKTMPRWLISEDRLKEQQEKGSKRGSAIVITVSNKIEAKWLLTNGFRFEGAVKKVEKYWEAGPGYVWG